VVGPTDCFGLNSTAVLGSNGVAMGQLLHSVICGLVIMAFLQGTLVAAVPGMSPSQGATCHDQAAPLGGDMGNPQRLHDHASVASADLDQGCCPACGEADCCNGDCGLCGHCSAAAVSTVHGQASPLRLRPGSFTPQVLSLRTPPLKEPPKTPHRS
jgi:hypothetical protein